MSLPETPVTRRELYLSVIAGQSDVSTLPESPVTREEQYLDYIAKNGGGGSSVQSDWNEADDTKPDYIKNKPTIPDVSGKQDKTLSSSVTIGTGTETTVEGAVGAVADVIPGTATSGNKLAVQNSVNTMFQSIMPNNEIIYDSADKPSVMYKLPKMTWAELGIGTSTDTFPAWIINGQEVDYIYISKYQNIVSDGKAYSLPAQDPKVEITFDNAVSACSAKGDGWHMTTRLEWMAVALLCLKNGTQPKGNNDYGKDVSETPYVGIPCGYDSQGRTTKVQTGTGPLSWSHNGLPSGIWDLNGNIWEWGSGIRLVHGELQVLSKDGLTFGNDAADPNNSQAADSALWYAIDGTTGALIVPNGSGTTSNSLKASWVSDAFKWITGTIANAGSHYCLFGSVSVDSNVCEAAQHILQALGMYKSTTSSYNDDRFALDTNQDECAFLVGGSWNNGSRAGIFVINGNNDRSTSSDTVGFRSTYTPIPTEE